MQAEAFTQLLRSHRSIRSYRPDPIAPALIEAVCTEAIAGGSSSGNLNAVSIILTRDQERKRRLYELHFEQPMVLEAPLVMTFCADWVRTRDWLKSHGARDNFNNFKGFLVGAFDAVIVAQNVALAFESHGLGICYMGTTLMSCTEISAFLETPETVIPVTSLVVGYPAENPGKRDRLPLSSFLHDERYHRANASELAQNYQEREVKGWDRYMAITELRELAESSGIRSLAEFYTSEHKYDPEEFRVFSEKLVALLQQKHFMV